MSTLKSLHKGHLKNVSEVKVEEFKFLIFLTHSTLYDHENFRNSVKKLKISVNTQKFAQSSLDECFGSESGRIQVFDIFNSFHALRALKLKKFTKKLKISIITQKFAQSSLEERFGSESGRIQVFDIFNSFHTV